MQSIKGKLERSRPFEWAKEKNKSKDGNNHSAATQPVPAKNEAEDDNDGRKTPGTEGRTKSQDAKQKVLNLFLKDKSPQTKSKRSSPEHSRSPSVSSSIRTGDQEQKPASGNASTAPPTKPFHKSRQKLGRSRDSNESSRSRSSVSLFAPLPFPLLRSQSSNTGSSREASIGLGLPGSMPPRPRCRTDGDIPESEKQSDAPAVVLTPSLGSSVESNPRSFVWPHSRSYSSSRSPSRPPSRATMPNIPELPKYDGEITAVTYASSAAEVFEEAECLPFVYEQLASRPESFYSDALQFLIVTHFSFKGFPVDMALRLFLLNARLPSEAQQIERMLQAFSEVYVLHNPDVFSDVDQALYVVFSLVILHTDTFNRNVKHKMSKSDYVQAAYTEGVATEVLEYLYDNITCAQFVKTEGDLASATSSLGTFSPGGHLDPYQYIIEKTLDQLRPTLPEYREPCISCPLESLEQLSSIKNRFSEGCGHTIQLVSPRSRPEAHIDVQEPQDVITQGRPGVVELKLVRHGVLQRPEAKRMLASRSNLPWRGWGAALTESKLYLFKNASRISACDESAPDVLARTTIDSLNATTIPVHDVAVLLNASAKSCEDPPADQTLVLTGRGGNVTTLATGSPEDAISWAQNLNYSAVLTTYALHPDPEARRDTIHHHLAEIDRKISDLDDQMAGHERTYRHLKLLAPLQQKTREGVMFAAGIYASKRDWCSLDRARLSCHKNILELELEILK